MAKKKLYDENGNQVKGKIKKPFYKKVWFWIVVIIFISVLGNMGSEDEVVEKQVQKESSVATEVSTEIPSEEISEESSSEVIKETIVAEEVESVEEVEEVIEEPKITSEESVPVDYISALKSGENYSDMMYMSKIGLFDQLTSEYGDQFSQEAAQYAVDNIDADWKENALKSGKNYQETMSMSPEAIRDQLSSEYGEQFTQEEADYAVENLNK